MTTRWAWATRVVVVGAAAGLGIAGLWYMLRPAPVRVAAAMEREVVPAVQGVGTVEAKVVVRVASKIPGRLVAVQADQGDRVHAGQLLVRLDRTEHEAQVQQAEAAVQRARLAMAAQGVALRKAQAGIESADAAVARLRAAAALAQANAERWRQLHREGGVPRVEMDARVMDATAAREEVRSAGAHREAAVEEVALAHATLDTLRQEVRVADAALAATRARAADTEIWSPLDSVVVSRELEPGATVGAGTTILKLADPRSAWVTVHVDEHETGGLRVGDPAEISLRSLPGRRLAGRVARIQRESDRVTEQLAVDVAFLEPPERLTLGEQAEAAVRPAPSGRVTAIPLGAVVLTPEGAGAWVVLEGRARFRAVRLGAADPDGWIEVVDGVAAGEEVVVAPGLRGAALREGRRVLAVQTEPEPGRSRVARRGSGRAS